MQVSVERASSSSAALTSFLEEVQRRVSCILPLEIRLTTSASRVGLQEERIAVLPKDGDGEDAKGGS